MTSDAQFQDLHATIDDFEHARLCMERAAPIAGTDDDVTLLRALFNSALISVRRVFRDSRSMAGKGKMHRPFTQAEAATMLAKQSLDLDEYLRLADKFVAHSNRLEGERTVDIVSSDDDGSVTSEGHTMLPSKQQVDDLRRIATVLKMKSIMAMSSDDSRSAEVTD